MNSVKKITKILLIELQSIYWPILAGHTVFPLEVAVNYKIPLIIWGAHQGLEQVGMFSHKHEVRAESIEKITIYSALKLRNL